MLFLPILQRCLTRLCSGLASLAADLQRSAIANPREYIIELCDVRITGLRDSTETESNKIKAEEWPTLIAANVVRLDKGHTKGIEPSVTEHLVKLIVSAKGGKTRKQLQ